MIVSWCIPDTDSLKLLPGYDKKVIDDYNNQVLKKIDNVCKILGIDKEKFSPTDIKGIPHTLGLFEHDGQYEEFITQGAKKYAYITKMPLDKAKKKDIYNIIRTKDDTAWCIGITVSGVPKKGSKGLKDLRDFRDDFIFEHKYTNKNMLLYNDEQIPVLITDYQKRKYMAYDKYGACMLPTTYELGKSEEYAELVKDESSSRAYYIER